MFRLTLLLGLLISGTAAGQEQSIHWVRVTDHAAWQPRDSQGELVYRDKLWIFGGWFNSFAAPPRDVWSTADGANWERITEDAPWKHSDLPMTAVFRDRMWFMGGWYNGRLPGHEATNAVWSSTDGKTWDAAPAAGWSPRIAAATVVFKNKLWILGGTENYYFGDASSLKNDVWTTADGKTWTRATEHAGWSPRAYHQAVVLNDRLYLMGGGNYVPQYSANNEVWSTADGVEWVRETEAAPWLPRLWFSAEVYRGRMWVLGGWSNNPSKNWGDVWHSADGKTWTELKTPGGWKERHEHSAFVWRDKLWLAGGHAQPLSNEVWSLELPKDWQP